MVQQSVVIYFASVCFHFFQSLQNIYAHSWKFSVAQSHIWAFILFPWIVELHDSKAVHNENKSGKSISFPLTSGIRTDMSILKILATMRHLEVLSAQLIIP